jgi:glycosyltransferase involved in cell wall biosynthesis
VEYKLVIDTSVYTGFPSREITKWFETKGKFNDLIKQFQPDAVFVDRQINFGLAASKLKIPLFVHLRGDIWSESMMAKQTMYKSTSKRSVIWFKERIAKKCFENSTSILPICKYLENKVKEHFPEKKTDVLYQGIEPSNWYYQKGLNLKHPCVGLLQNADIFEKAKELEILPKVLEAFPKVMFYWVGDGPYKETILPTLEKHENFQWMGKLEYPEKVRQFLSAIDIYALLTGIDMSPLTLQEAQLMEKPVVATNVGGVPELLQNEKTGFLVEPNETSKLEESLTLLLEDEKKRKEMGKKGREFIKKKFSWEIITKQFSEVMKNNI